MMTTLSRMAHVALALGASSALCVAPAPPDGLDSTYGAFGTPANATLTVAPQVLLRRASAAPAGACDNVRYFRAHHAHHARFWMARDSYGAAVMNSVWFSGRERAYGDVFDYVLDGAAGQRDGSLVVDVGSNAGWYSLFALARGFRVLAVDMQPECTRRARCAAAMNRVAHGRLRLHTAYVTDVEEGAPPLVSQSQECIGALSIAWAGLYEWSGATQRVPPLHLGRHLAELLRLPPGAPSPRPGHLGARGAIAEAAASAAAATAADGAPSTGAAASSDWGRIARIPLLKVDIEGGEVTVARSLGAAPGVLALVDHIVAEYSPHMWGALNISTADGVAAFAPLFAAGFVAVDLPENYMVRPARWRVAPDTGPGIMRSVAALAGYTRALLDATDVHASIHTLWLFRETAEAARA